MIDHLYRIAIRILAIEAPGTVTMCFWLCYQHNAVVVQETVPVINQFRFLEDKSYMVQALRTSRGFFRGHPVNGQVIVAGTKVQIILIRTPLDGHPDQVHVEMLACLKIFHIQGNVVHSTCWRWSGHLRNPGLFVFESAQLYTSICIFGRTRFELARRLFLWEYIREKNRT